jgi:hypothetical protein
MPQDLVAGDFVVVRALKTASVPFYVAQVVDNEVHEGETTL